MNTQLEDDVNKARDRIERLLQDIEKLEHGGADTMIQIRRTERELREEKEKSLRLERELEGWKGLRMERRSHFSETGSRKGSGAFPAADLQRMPSNTKGFL